MSSQADTAKAAGGAKGLSVTSLTSTDIAICLEGHAMVPDSSVGGKCRRSTVPLVLQDARSGCQTSAQLLKRQKVCRFCLKVFEDDRNLKGDCTEAPDKVRRWIERATCLGLAEGVSYHCCADEEGDYKTPCHENARDSRCDDDDDEAPDDPDSRENKLTIQAWVCVLAMCVPCLCCYPFCTLLHRTAKRHHWVGARHSPLQVKKDVTRNTIAACEDDQCSA